MAKERTMLLRCNNSKPRMTGVGVRRDKALLINAGKRRRLQKPL
jgi:hypothetical protein